MKIIIKSKTDKAKNELIGFVEQDNNVKCINPDPYTAEFDIKAPVGMKGKLSKAFTKIPANMLIIAVTPWLNENIPTLMYGIDYTAEVTK